MPSDPLSTGTATGRVFEDQNGNCRFDPVSDQPVPGVGVSDGGSVVLSAEDGSYRVDLTSQSHTLFITQPAGYTRTQKFYLNLDNASKVQHDFALTKSPAPDPVLPRFVQTTDIHIHGEPDREPFARAIEEINHLAPAAHFVVATGDLIEDGDHLNEFEVYTSTTQLSRIPWFHVYGNHDQNRDGREPAANYRRFLGPDYYSADFGDLHLVMLNSVHPSERQDRWLEQDIRLLGRGKRIVAFQHYATDAQTIAKLQRYGVKAVFTGHWHSNKMTAHGDGLLSINHPTFIMGGIDGSPSSFRIIEVTEGGFSSEFRFNDFGKRLHLVYPQKELAGGPTSILAEIYDTSGGVKDAQYQFTYERPNGQPQEVGDALVKRSPLLWGSSSVRTPHILAADESGELQLAVTATNYKDELWSTSATITIPPITRPAIADVRTRADWPQFMGNAQRTGASDATLTPPLAMK